MQKWLYKEGEEPKLFKGEDAIAEAEKNGWVDSPKGFKKTIIQSATGEKEEVATVGIDTFSDEALFDEAIKRKLVNENPPIQSYTNEEILVIFEEIKSECIKRGLEIEEVIPHDIDGDGEGDVDLNSLDRDELYEMAIKAELKVPANIGKDKLIERLLESEGA